MLHVLAELKENFAVVEHVMAEALATDEPRVRDLLDSLGGFHGKMLRPALVILVARAVGEVLPVHHRLGAALEMIHTATLIHDDMIDEGETRRGKPTAHVRYGTPTAVLLGDFFYTNAFHLVAQLGDAWVMQQLTRTTNVVCEGELNQMCARRDLGLTEAEYERIIYAKTAALCETACALGAIEGDERTRAAAGEYGRLLGMAFQIVDDCLDLSGDPEKVGKTLATDIERGRLTLPFLRLLALVDEDEDEREAIGQQLLNVTTEAEVEAVKALVVERGGVADAIRTARDYVAQAKGHLDGLPPGNGRDQLAALADFVVARDF